MIVTIYSICVWISMALVGSLCLVIFLGSNTLSSKAFAQSILWVTIWIGSIGLFISIQDYETSIFYARLTYYLGTVIASSFLYFFITYPYNEKPGYKFTLTIILFEAVLAYIFLLTNRVIYDTFSIKAGQPWGWVFGSLSSLFEFTFFGFFIIGIVILYRKFIKTTNTNDKANLKYMLWTIIIGATPASLVCIILPRIGYFDLNWLGPTTEVIWLPIIAYSIIKYQQMNVKAVITEVLAIGMVVIFFLNIFVSTPFGLWGRVIIFIILLVMAYFLIKTTLNEAKQRTLLSSLNHNLEQKVAEQTADVRRAYEIEKKARAELEALNATKDEFISKTQHHLRTPLTSLKWELESMKNIPPESITPEIKKSIDGASEAIQTLSSVIENFIGITGKK